MARLLRLTVAVGAALAVFGAPAPGFAQFVDEHFDPLPTVPDPGTYPTDVQGAIEEGYRQLDLVESPADDARLEPAKAAFERALDADPRAVHALNGKGIYELAKDEQWLVVFESIKKLFNRDHISMAIKAFEEALEVDPGFHAARYNLALAYRQARGEDNYRKAAAELETLVSEAPEFASAPLLLALTYRDAGAMDAMRDAVEGMPTSPAFPEATRRLLLAYALFNSERPDEAAEAYWEGIDAIEDDTSAELFWHDLRPVVAAEADAAFHATPLEEKPAFVRNRWQRMADQSFVTVDERLAEHYRRLQHAYANYRLALPERRHYSAITAYTPPWQTGFDDRGVIYLRHGEPDDTATYSGPEVEKNVSWKYERPDGDPLVFHFVADEDSRDYKLVRTLRDVVLANSTKMTGTTLLDPNAGSTGRIAGVAGLGIDANDSRILASERQALQQIYSSRGHLDPFYDRAATGLDPLLLQDEETLLGQDIQLAVHTQSYTPTVDEPLRYPVYPVPFKTADGFTEVAFYYALPTAEISILPRDGGSAVDYRYQLQVGDLEGGDDPTRQERDVRIATSQPIPQGAGTMLPGVRMVRLGPGVYDYGMKITDLNSGRFGVIRGSVDVDPLADGDLAMSGVLLAHRVEPVRGDGPFVRWGRLKVLPLPSRVFRRSQPVYIYYEVYGLDAAGGDARYRTTYTLRAREADRNVVAKFFSAVGDLLGDEEERGRVTYSFERSQPDGESDPLLEYISLDVSESPAGDYTLDIEVEDLSVGGSVRRSVPLTLVE